MHRRAHLSNLSCLATLLAAFWLLVSPASAALHPQDGPHADVRIRIDEEGVRFDMMLNLAFIDEIAPEATYRENPQALDPVEEEMIREALVRAFLDRNSVSIDGVEVTPVVRGFRVMRPGVELLPLFPVTGMRGLIRAELELWYPAKSPPQRASLVWGLYPRDFVTRPDDPEATITIEAQLSAEGLFEVIRLTETEPEYVWHSTGETAEDRFLAVPEPVEAERPSLPVLSAGLAGLGAVALLALGFSSGARRRAAPVAGVALLAFAGSALAWPLARWELPIGQAAGASLPTEQQAVDIFRPLHANIYRAFDYEAEGDIYDALARSVTGELLDSLYNEIYQSLIMREEGGAVSRVQSVEVLGTEILSVGLLGDESRPGFTVRCRWRVEGSVYHWGHTHTRINEYLADYTVVQTDAGWRIAGTKTLEQFRVDSDPLLPGADGEVPDAPPFEIPSGGL